MRIRGLFGYALGHDTERANERPCQVSLCIGLEVSDCSPMPSSNNVVFKTTL